MYFAPLSLIAVERQMSTRATPYPWPFAGHLMAIRTCRRRRALSVGHQVWPCHHHFVGFDPIGDVEDEDRSSLLRFPYSRQLADYLSDLNLIYFRCLTNPSHYLREGCPTVLWLVNGYHRSSRGPPAEKRRNHEPFIYFFSVYLTGNTPATWDYREVLLQVMGRYRLLK